MALDDKIRMMMPDERRINERHNIGEPCIWHRAKKSIPVYKGKLDKRSPLYACVKLCDGYRPNCHARLKLIEYGIIK